MRLALCVAMLCGCDKLFGVDAVSAVDASDGSRPIDAAHDAGPDAPRVFVGPRVVFVTSGTATGNMFGLAGADAACAQAATVGVLTGTFRAWLSSSTVDARARLAPGGGPIVLRDGTQVAASWLALLGGTLDHEIDLDETGNAQQFTCSVWTNTSTDGTRLSSNPSDDCADWTSASGTSSVSPLGEPVSKTASWTEAGGCSATCDTPLELYCLQDLP